MPNPRLAYRYAKSIIDIAVETGQLETVYADMKYMQQLFKVSRDFVNLLRSPIVTPDKKASVLVAVTENKVSALTASFNKLVVTKGRESGLPEIVNAVVEQYNKLKGIHQVRLTTAVEISDDIKNILTAKLNNEASLGKIELETKTDESLIGGFVLEFNNNLLDASIARDLADIKKQFNQNTYVMQMR
jgi:F-type H+-transporting ATPase subunit delta